MSEENQAILNRAIIATKIWLGFLVSVGGITFIKGGGISDVILAVCFAIFFTLGFWLIFTRDAVTRGLL